MFLIDNNLPPRLAVVLKDVYEGLVHVADVGLDEEDDLKIWQYAKDNELDILSKDADFNDLQQLKGYPPKIIWIRSGNVTTSYIIQLLQSRKKDILDFLNDDSLGILQIQ